MLTTQSVLRLHVTATEVPQGDNNAPLCLTGTTGPLQHWVHPSLTQGIHPNKGRQLQASHLIRKGEIVLIDVPYALIPVSMTEPEVEPGFTTEPPESTSKTNHGNKFILCSNPQCNRLAPPSTQVSCLRRCAPDVTWCSQLCRETDHQRHEFECTWLSRYATPLRSRRGEYNFGMLWLIVRILANRHMEEVPCKSSPESPVQLPQVSSSFKAGWEAIQSLCGSPETWSHSQVREWSALVKKYLGSGSTLPHGLSADEILALICREEANSFGLYPRETGVLSLSALGPPVNRGKQFGAAVYPRASIANHSCCPNMKHKPDELGRMVFTATRDIAAGEECCISYFDVVELVDFKDRRTHLQSLFRFVCDCSRCLEEEQPEQEEAQWDALPGFD